MITFFTTAKPFLGHNAVIQRNALMSWQRVHPQAEVILFGDEEGAAETARDLGIRHVATVQRESGGPKVLRSFFDAAQRMARHELLCYANCDIVLTRDFLHAVNAADAVHDGFLMVGRRWNLDWGVPIAFAAGGWEELLLERAHETGELTSGDWIDYFVFRKGLYLGKLPELVIGRVHWDQWMVWKARESGAAVVDATEAATAIHQNHDYTYHPGGKNGVWSDEYSRRNYRLAGGRWHLRTIDDATHVLGPDGLRENPRLRKRTAQRMLRTLKEAAWMTAMDWTRPARAAVGLRRHNGSAGAP